MPLLCARVDNRLVHGQVLEGWVPGLGIDLVVVADEALCSDDFQKAVFEAMGAGWPEIEIVPPYRAATVISSNPGRNVMLLFRDLASAVLAMESGLPLAFLNLGNIHFSEGSLKITDSVYVDRSGVASLCRLL
ncbi:PTS sugar transporter subunit IIB, partial [bacterium]